MNRIFYAKDKEQYCSGFIPPDEILINNIKHNYVHYEYDFEKEENEVKLIWHNKIRTLCCCFFRCSNITFADLSHFNTSNPISIGELFNKCSSLKYVNFNNFDTSKCQYMSWMFGGCNSLISLDLSNFNTESVIKIAKMFINCNKLQYINMKNFKLNDHISHDKIIDGIPNNVRVCIYEDKAPYLYGLIKNLNDSHFDCSDDWFIRNNIFNYNYIKLKVKGNQTNRIFSEKENLIPPDEVLINNIKQKYVHHEYNFDKEENEVILVWYNQINHIVFYFYNCDKITFADLSHFNSSNIEYIAHLFDGCTSLKYVNFNNFDTSKCKHMHWMFGRCYNLISLDLSSFNTKNVNNIKGMFGDCRNLKYLNIKNFELKNSLDYTTIIGGIPGDIRVCINEYKASYLYGLIKNLSDPHFDCSEDWFIRNNIFNYEYITLKVKGKGMNRIFYEYDIHKYCPKFKLPDEVLINNKKQNYVYYEYNFEQEENEVKLVWYNKINDLGCGFYRCSNITYVDLSHFDSSNIESTAALFNGCLSLIYINFTNFNTSNCQDIHYMFKNCTSLISLDLSNFDTKRVSYINGIFYGCNNLQYINLKNFEFQGNITGDEIFGIPKNVIACIYQEKASYLYQLIESLDCSNIYCEDDWYLHQKKINEEATECFDKCDKKYEFNSICYDKCPYGIFYDEKNSVEKCKCEDDKCSACLNLEKVNNLCISCNNSFYPIENDPINIGPYINCYKNPVGYYLDKSEENNYIYKLCYEKCKTCEIKGDDTNNNCIECSTDYPFGIQINDYLNCYPNCEYYYYFDEKGNYHCTEKLSCPNEYNKLVVIRFECIKDCELDNENKYEFNFKCYPKSQTEEIIKAEIEAQNKIKEKFEKGFTSENFDTTELEDGKEAISQTDKMTITLTTTDNQKINSKNDTSSKVNIGPCEDILRKVYNISEDKQLFMMKIDVPQKGMDIPKIEFDIYCKLNGSNLVKLNKSHCRNVKAELSVHVILKDDIEKLNTSSRFYNDICYVIEDGTYKTREDRKREYIEGNKAVCQDGCVFSDYDYETLRAKCSCEIKESSSSFALMNIDKDKLFGNFVNIKNIANFNILKCYKQLFSIKGIKKNIGAFIIIPIIIFHIICIVLFYKKNLSLIQDKIKDIIFGIKNWKLIKQVEREKKLKIKKEKKD